MMDNYLTGVEKISDNDLANQFFHFYTNYREQEEMMEQKMYLRGFKDCIELLKKTGVI